MVLVIACTICLCFYCLLESTLELVTSCASTSGNNRISIRVCLIYSRTNLFPLTPEELCIYVYNLNKFSCVDWRCTSARCRKLYVSSSICFCVLFIKYHGDDDNVDAGRRCTIFNRLRMSIFELGITRSEICVPSEVN